MSINLDTHQFILRCSCGEEEEFYACRLVRESERVDADGTPIGCVDDMETIESLYQCARCSSIVNFDYYGPEDVD